MMKSNVHSKQQRLCDVEGCNGIHQCRGFCPMHLYRMKAHGSVVLPIRERRLCSVEECERYSLCKGYCDKHYRRVKKHGDVTRSRPTGENHPFWKGDNVGYASLHGWIKRKLPKTSKCQYCKIKPAYDLANINQEYRRDLSDWEWLCRRCHMLKDGRLAKVGHYKKKRLLTDDQIRYIREQYNLGQTMAYLARKFKITYQTIGCIIYRRTYKNIL